MSGRTVCGLGLFVGVHVGLYAFFIGAADAKAPKPTATPRRLTPRHDAPDQLFRRAPMAEASRSIVIPLATNLHWAFDAQLLRTHTVSRGTNLNVFGPPFHGAKSPFLCTFEGVSLWTMPPLCPWSFDENPTSNLNPPASGTRFKSINTRDGTVQLSYELATPGGGPVSITETAARLELRSGDGLVRRLTIGPCDRQLFFLAHAEMGSLGRQDKNLAVIKRSNDVLLAALRVSSGATWRTVEKQVDYEVPMNIEKNGESDIRYLREAGRQARLSVSIPAHRETLNLEIATAIVANENEASDVAAHLAKDDSSAAATSAPKAGKPPVKKFAGDPAAALRSSGDAFYRIEHFPLPKEIQLQATGMDWISSGELAVCTWSGDIYIVENAEGPVEGAKYRRFARGLNEPLGIKAVGGQLYIVQKCDLTRITDTDRDGEADLFETLNSDWGYSGNYHAFAFGPVIDKQNNLYAFICGQRGRWEIPYVGWCVRIDPKGGSLEGICRGLRAPNGYGTFGPDDDLFIADNQGNWIGACKLNHLERGRFYGFPSGRPAPKEEYDHPKDFSPPAIWFPRKLSPSTSGFVTVEDDRFGPFKGQMVIGDFQNAVVMRVFLEKVNGQWQGAVWPFAKGFLSGVNRLVMGQDAKLYVGGLKNSAWAAAGLRDYSLDRVSFTGKVPFEIKEARALGNGFDLVLTQPAKRALAEDVQNYSVAQYNYEYHQAYGSAEFDHAGKENSATEIKVAKASLSEDGMIIRLTVEGWRTGYVTMVQIFGITNDSGDALWHDTFYYTLNQTPH